MSTLKNDGGPAFPWSPDGPNYQTYPGMSLRDWFAGQALAGMNAHDADVSFRMRAEDAYKYADAMLAEREAKK